MNTFVITSGETDISKGTSHCRTYGLVAVYNDVRLKIEDITTDREKIEYIAATLNAEQPELVHLEEILENFLLDFNGF